MRISQVLLLATTACAHLANMNDHYHDGHYRVTVQQPVHRPLTRHHVNVHSQQSYTDASVRQMPVNSHHQRTVTLVHPQTVHQPTVHETSEPFVRHDLVNQHVEHPHHEDTVDVTARNSAKARNMVDTVATARIIRHDSEVNPDGSFFNVWNSENGISVQEQGTVKHVGDADVIVSNGEISYTDDDGNSYHLRYVADENGFRPEGDHLPKPPPIPQGIARGLEFIATHPYVEPTTGHVGQSTGDSPTVIDN